VEIDLRPYTRTLQARKLQTYVNQLLYLPWNFMRIPGHFQ